MGGMRTVEETGEHFVKMMLIMEDITGYSSPLEDKVEIMWKPFLTLLWQENERTRYADPLASS